MGRAVLPGTKLAITEYNWGGTESLNGALAEADVLGIFGREGVGLATMWDPPASIRRVRLPDLPELRRRGGRFGRPVREGVERRPGKARGLRGAPASDGASPWWCQQVAGRPPERGVPVGRDAGRGGRGLHLLRGEPRRDRPRGRSSRGRVRFHANIPGVIDHAARDPHLSVGDTSAHGTRGLGRSRVRTVQSEA